MKRKKKVTTRLRWYFFAPLLLIPLTFFPLASQEPKVIKGVIENKAKEEKAEKLPIPVPAKAVIDAFNDLPNIPDEPIYYRYFWFRENDPVELKKDMQSFLFDLNSTAQLGVNLPYRPVQIAENILRVDLRCVSEDLAGLKKNLELYEEYRFDPDFSTLFTKETLEFVKFDKEPVIKSKVAKKVNEREVESEPYQHNGITYKKKWVYDTEWEEKETPITEIKDQDVIRLDPEHVDLEPYCKLKHLLQTEAPIINADYYSTRAMSSIEGKGVFKTIFGGLYYRHKNLDRAKAGDETTDEDLLLKRLGVKKSDFVERKSDRRLAMFASKITGCPRIVEWAPHIAAPPEMLPIITVTGDVSRTDIDIGRRPMYDLIDPRVTAREWLITCANGTILYVLSSAIDGKLAEKAPDDIARDHTVAPPNTTELFTPHSCISCHGPHDGWQPAVNDIEKVFRLDGVFGQLKNLKNSFNDITRVKNLYKGNPDNLFRMLRTLHAGAVLQITGPWVGAEDQTKVVQLTYAQSTKRWREYNFGLVGAKKALYELGFDTNSGEAAVTELEKLLPPLKVGLRVGHLVSEDIRTLALINEIEMPRSDWALYYSFAATRTQNTLRLKNEENPIPVPPDVGPK
jgi:hypothetical protein